MGDTIIAKNDPKLSDMYYEVVKLLTFVANEILYPVDNFTDEDDVQYEESLTNIEMQYIPQLKAMIEGTDVVSRGIADNLMAVVLDKHKVILSFLTAASEKLHLSGMSGVAYVIAPFISKLRQDPRLVGVLSSLRGKSHTFEEGLNTLNQVTGGMIRPLSQLSFAIGGLKMAVDTLMDESVKTPRDMMEYIISTLIEVNEEDNTLMKTMNTLCTTLERVELDMDQETKIVTVMEEEEEAASAPMPSFEPISPFDPADGAVGLQQLSQLSF